MAQEQWVNGPSPHNVSELIRSIATQTEKVCDIKKQIDDEDESGIFELMSHRDNTVSPTIAVFSDFVVVTMPSGSRGEWLCKGGTQRRDRIIQDLALVIESTLVGTATQIHRYGFGLGLKHQIDDIFEAQSRKLVLRTGTFLVPVFIKLQEERRGFLPYPDLWQS